MTTRTLAEAYKILAAAPFISVEMGDLMAAARARTLTTEQIARIHQLAGWAAEVDAIKAQLSQTYREIAAKRKAADAEKQAAWHPRNDDPLIDEIAVSPTRYSADTTFEQSAGRYTGSRRAGD
jgi:hypothetical protein